MARAGYDPRDMANMFKTIEKRGRLGRTAVAERSPESRQPLRVHHEEAQMLQVENPIRDTRAFDQVRAHLRRLPPAPTTEEATRNAKRGRTDGGGAPELPSGRVEPPSSRTRVQRRRLFRVSVPSNWRELQRQQLGDVRAGGRVRDSERHSVFTHGVEIGIARNETHDLQTATDELIDPRAGQPAHGPVVATGTRRSASARASDDALQRLGRDRRGRNDSDSPR